MDILINLASSVLAIRYYDIKSEDIAQARRRGRVAALASRVALLNWADAFDIADSTFEAMRAALDLATDHQIRIWDALILSVAADQKCRLLLSEDFQHGFTWRGVTVVDPFRAPQHALLTALLR